MERQSTSPGRRARVASAAGGAQAQQDDSKRSRHDQWNAMSQGHLVVEVDCAEEPPGYLPAAEQSKR